MPEQCRFVEARQNLLISSHNVVHRKPRVEELYRFSGLVTEHFELPGKLIFWGRHKSVSLVHVLWHLVVDHENGTCEATLDRGNPRQASAQVIEHSSSSATLYSSPVDHGSLQIHSRIVGAKGRRDKGNIGEARRVNLLSVLSSRGWRISRFRNPYLVSRRSYLASADNDPYGQLPIFLCGFVPLCEDSRLNLHGLKPILQNGTSGLRPDEVLSRTGDDLEKSAAERDFC